MCCTDDPVTERQHEVGVGGVEQFTTTQNVAVLKISCEYGAYHLSKPFISDYEVVVSLFV